MSEKQVFFSVGAIALFVLIAILDSIFRSKKHAELNSWIANLIAFFKGALSPVETNEMRELFAAKDFTNLVGTIKRHLRLDFHLRVGYVKSGGDANSPAWIVFPQPMPPYGTESFRKTTATMFIRNEFIRRLPFETVVIAIAHEMCHIILEATGHPLKKNEKIVDLTAMVLGFSELYAKGVAHEESFEVYDDAIQGDSFVLPKSASRSKRILKYKFGYLTLEEVERASLLIARARKSTATSVAK